MSTPLRGIGAIVGVLSLAMTAACGGSGQGSSTASASNNEFVIGVIDDQSGGSTFYSQTGVRALKVYVESLNAGKTLYASDILGTQVGILGKKIRLIFEDDQNNPNITTLKAKSLLDKGAQALFFTSGSSSTIQGRAVCTQEKVFCFAPTNVNAKIVQPPNNEFIFTAAPASGLAADAYVKAWGKLGYKSIAFFGENTATSKAVGDAYKGVAKGAGMTIVADETVEVGARDATAQIARIQKAHPDVVFDATQAAAESALLYKGLNQTGGTVPVWASNALTAQPKTWQIVGDAINGVRVVDPFSPENKHAQQVMKLLKDAGNEDYMTFIQTTTWDALLLTKYAFEKARSTQGTAAVAALEGVSDFPSATGQSTFTYTFGKDRHNGSAPDQNVVIEFKDGTPSHLVADLQPPA